MRTIAIILSFKIVVFTSLPHLSEFNDLIYFILWKWNLLKSDDTYVTVTNTWTSDELLSSAPLGMQFSEIWTKLKKSFKGKCTSNCHSYNVKSFVNSKCVHLSGCYCMIYFTSLKLEIPEMITNFKPNGSLGTVSSWSLSSLFLSYWMMPHRRKQSPDWVGNVICIFCLKCNSP